MKTWTCYWGWLLVWLAGAPGALGQNRLPAGVPVSVDSFYATLPAAGNWTVVNVEGQPNFNKARRVTVNAVSPEFFRVGAAFRTAGGVVQGESLRLSLWARNVGAEASARLRLKFQDPLHLGDANLFSESQEIVVSNRDWQPHTFDFVSKVTLAAGAGEAVIFFGDQVQTLEVADLRLEPVTDVCDFAPDDWLGRVQLANANASDSTTRLSEPVGGCFMRLITGGGREDWRPQLLASFPEALRRGDILDCTLRLRMAAGSAAGEVQVALQRVGGANVSSRNLTASAEWQTHRFGLVAQADFNGVSGNPAQLALNFGFHGQTVEVAELNVTNLGQAHPDTPAHRVLAGFRRGVNLGNYLEYANCPPQRPPLPLTDFTAIRQEGFDHVRVPVAWHQGNGPAPGFAIAPCRWQQADWMITNAVAAGLGVVVDLHHFDDFNRLNPVAQRPRFVALWKQVAEHYAAMPTNVIFELLNEPFHFAGTDADLNQAYAEALAAIRVSGGLNATRMVLISPAELKRGPNDPYVAHWKRLGTLRFPANDAYVAATVHNYDPFQFTHQGADFTGTSDNLTTNLVFPGPPPTPRQPDPRVKGTDALKWLTDYNDPTKTGLNNPSSGRDIQFFADTVLAWALPAGRAVYVGEYGAFEAADPQSRVNYARAAREIFEAAGLGWAWWNWNSDFHYIRRAGSVYQPSPPGLRAALLPKSPLGTNVAPAIFSQPQSTNLNEGSSVSLRVEADGSGPLQFQWRRNGGLVTGATLPALELKNVTLAVAGSYTVVVSNGAGSVTSAPAVVTVVVPPEITQQPASVTVNQGLTASFTVVALGTAPLSYQWVKGEAELPGETGATLTLPDVTVDTAGSYRVIVSNPAGSLFSNPAILTVVPFPNRLTLSCDLLDDRRLRVHLSGSPGVTYEIETSTDAMAWETVLTGGAETGNLEYTTPLPVMTGTRFFRGKTR